MLTGRKSRDRSQRGLPANFMNSRDLSAILDRHQQRREADLPTVSVLAGPVGVTIREVGRWAEARGRTIVTVDVPRLDAMVDAWAECLATHRDLVRDAVEHLARRAGCSGDDLKSRLVRMTSMEVNLFFESLPPGRDRPGVEAACRWIVGVRGNGPRLALLLGESIVDRIGDDPRERAVIALGNLIPPGTGPVLLAARPGGPAQVEAIARVLGRLALLQPRLTAILAVEPGDLDAYLREATESREKALIRSGVVEVPGPDDEARSQPPAPIETPEVDDEARSAAERFLFESLAAHPQTAGLFELNATLDIPFGPGRAMEVDLCSRALGIAIEVDGYHHFQDAESYRRDRRKDYLLQGRGYLVIRVLADDVVPRLEETLDLIRSAVASRQGDPKPSNREANP